MSRSTILTALATAAALGVCASPAAASDATLKAEIAAVVPKVQPAVTAFVDTAEQVERSGDPKALNDATARVRKAISLYKWSVVNRKASTEAGLAGKQQLLVAIREYDIGFAAYQTAIDKATAGASKASFTKSLKTFAKRIQEAAKDEAAALEALGIEA